MLLLKQQQQMPALFWECPGGTGADLGVGRERMGEEEQERTRESVRELSIPTLQTQQQVLPAHPSP